jgi:hypothetical protein
MATTPLGFPRSYPGSASASRPRTAFVLSGGESLGALPVGMLQALDEHDVVPDLLVGTSARASTRRSSLRGHRPQPQERARAHLAQPPTRGRFPVSVTALVGGLCGRRDHLVSDRCALDVAIYGVRVLVDSRLESDIARYSPEAELIVLPAPNPGLVQPTSFEHSSRPISQALATTRTQLMQRHGRRHLELAV